MRISKDVSTNRAAVAGLKRAIRNGECPADDPRLAPAERQLRAAVLRSRAEKIVADWEPLTSAQRLQITNILNAAI